MPNKKTLLKIQIDFAQILEYILILLGYFLRNWWIFILLKFFTYLEQIVYLNMIF